LSTGIWIAASGAASQMTALDTAANNTANATTFGFKAEQAVFREVLADKVNAGNAVDQMRYNGVHGVHSDLKSGGLKVTERPLDVAISGEGFFAVQTQAGERYTRAGNFQVNSSGELVTADGARLLNTAQRPITVTPGAKVVAVGPNGTVTADDSPVGQLRTVTFTNQDALEREGHFLFRANAVSGKAAVAPLALETGTLEMSNVSIVKGMTDMVSITRTFDALEQVIQAFRQADQRAATDLMSKR
jgi:flagellar basal-body rod protein FlgF